MKVSLKMLVAVALAQLAGACAQTGSGVFRPDLNDDIVARVSLGHGEQQVTESLGKPYQQIRFDNLKSTAWDYLYKDTWGYWVELSVMIGDDGRVVAKHSRRLEPFDDR
jgi:outer membrane protein assembly factor BamE (lipoprotein component of BamABCDE complex)